MFDNIIGSILLEYLGAIIKWVISIPILFLKGEKPISFGQYWRKRKNSNPIDSIMGGVSNIFIGLLFLVLLILFLNKVL